MTPSGKQLAVRWHPPSFDIRLEQIDIPEIVDSDDAIVKVTLAALCGSDLHVYRGHGGVDAVHTCGHEFIGEVVALGQSFGPYAGSERPALYSTLKVGDKVVSPFTVNCGECHVCRVGYTCRCPAGALFGSPVLEGGQAQYLRVPKAGGTLFNLSDPTLALSHLQDSSLLLLADILPTGVFASLQALSHPKVLSFLQGRPWPFSLLPATSLSHGVPSMTESDRILTFAVVGLGPVGMCTCVSLLDMLATGGYEYRIVAIDPLASRREKMQSIANKIPREDRGSGQFVAQSIEEAKETVKAWTSGIGCTAVLEVVGNNSALTLAYELIRPFGPIVSVGVHGAPPLPLTGNQVYNKNVSLDFGRCPAKAMFPLALDLLVKRQDVFGAVGKDDSLIDRVVSLAQAPEMYRAFDKGVVGKIVFDPWM